MKGYPDTWAVTKTDSSTGSGDNTAEVITLAAATDERHVVDGIYWSYDGIATTGGLTISVDGTTEFDVDLITAAADSDSVLFENGFYGDAGVAVVVTLAAGGAGIAGKVNIVYR